ncbi:putative pentatricopeptide repeat-containing protein [Ananas comosus]|uniref:Putative pentatricopeptide repeat-containing protein n=1 Tax=Ananas comosus TaxID=4615 RepID=A0A199VPT2_ANACO|nr:putative pentatricopeptide repeat-containing protein [Ananas comosus]
MCLYTPSVRNSFSGLWNRLQVDRTVEISRSIFSERAPYHLLLLPRPPMRLSARRIGEGEGAPWNERESSLFVKAKETALLHVSIKSQKPFPSPHLLSSTGMSRTLLPRHVAAVIRHQKEPLRALDMFNSAAKDDGFRHTLFTYKCMVDKLGLHGEFKAMETVISEMRSNIDNSFLEEVYVSAMKSYGKGGRLQEAVNVFEQMDFFGCEPTVISYNVIMNILVEYRYYDQAHKVYLRMLDKKVIPDVHTFTVRIKSFCRTGRPHAALRLLRNIQERGYDAIAVAYCTVICGLYEDNFQVEAYDLFDEMLRREIFPDIVTFNKGLCKESKLTEAISLLENLDSNMVPDAITYNTLISGLCKNAKVLEAENYLHKMVNQGCAPDDFTYNTIIDGYCKIGMVQKSSEILKDAVFKGFAPDRVTYCSLINGMCQEGDINRALELFNEAKSKALKPDILVYNSLIKGLSRQGLILQALEVMNEMLENGCNPDIWTYNIIINGLCKMGNVSDAHVLLNDAIVKGYLPDVFTFNTLIDGYCKKLKLDSALLLVERMWTHGVTPDSVTYNSVLNGLCKAGKTKDVLEVFNEMVSKGCCPNVITYNILIENLCKAHKMEEASEIIVKMRSEGLSPDIVSFNTLIHGFCRNSNLDGAHEIFRKLEHEKFSPTIDSYNIMISAYSSKLNMHMAEKIFSEMVSKGCSPDAYTYRVLIDGYCKSGNVDRAYNFLISMVNEGHIPSMATFGRVINCLSVNHRSDEAVGIILIMVRNGVVPEVVHTILSADKKAIAAPKILVEEMLKKGHITYHAYELLYDGIRNSKVVRKRRWLKLI